MVKETLKDGFSNLKRDAVAYAKKKKADMKEQSDGDSEPQMGMMDSMVSSDSGPMLPGMDGGDGPSIPNISAMDGDNDGDGGPQLDGFGMWGDKDNDGDGKPDYDFPRVLTMKTVTVLPRDDGETFQQSWMVHKNGSMVSNHTTKDAATNKARQVANKGDTLEIRRVDGTIQSRTTVRGGSGESEDQSLFVPYGAGTAETAVSDFFKR